MSYVPVRSKKRISEILSALVGNEIILELDEFGTGVAEFKFGPTVYRLTYSGCAELENGTMSGTLVLIEEREKEKTHPWRYSALVH
jgi:hypothetical protein